MLLVSPVALLTRPRIPVSVCFPTGISSLTWLSFLLHIKIPINGMLAITLSLTGFIRTAESVGGNHRLEDGNGVADVDAVNQEEERQERTVPERMPLGG